MERLRVMACPICDERPQPLEVTVRTSTVASEVVETSYAYCTRCDFAFCIDPPTTEALASYYSTHTQLRRERLSIEEARHIGDQVRFATQNQITGRRVLEIGPDTGSFLTFLCQQHEMEGFYREHNPVARAALARAGHHEDDGGFYDLVAMRHVLEHITDPVDYLNALPADRVFVEVPDCSDLRAGVSDQFQFEHVGYYSLRAMDRLARTAGYIVEKSELAQTPGYSTTPNRVLRVLLTPGSGVQTFTDWHVFASERLADFRRIQAAISERPSVIYGAGTKTLEYLVEFGTHANIFAIYDRDPAKVGSNFFGLRVLPANELTDQYRVIVLVVGYQREVADFLAQRGITEYVFL